MAGSIAFWGEEVSRVKAEFGEICGDRIDMK
jgi:hypothetical protein